MKSFVVKFIQLTEQIKHFLCQFFCYRRTVTFFHEYKFPPLRMLQALFLCFKSKQSHVLMSIIVSQLLTPGIISLVWRASFFTKALLFQPQKEKLRCFYEE